MSPLRRALAGYLAVRRSLGYKLARPEKLLAQFITYLEARGAATVTTEHAMAWATVPGGDANWHAHRLSVVRGFAAYLHTIDPAAQIPPAGLIPARPRRATPYLYSDADIAALIAAAASLRSRLRAATYRTLIGLLAVTGMRVGEAIRLDRADLDLAVGVVTVRQAKFGKSRLLPLHPSATAALRGYLRLRDRLCPQPSTAAVFISPAGTRLLYCNVHATWKLLAASAGLHPRSAACRPRIHDLRHSFAVRSLLDAYAAGQDGQVRLALLSTYMGHADPRPYLLVPVRGPGTARPGRAAARGPPGWPAVTALAPTLQAFFTDRLARQRHASPDTIAAYRDTWRLLLGYASGKTGKQPSRLDLADLDAPLIGTFLDHLEQERGNSPRTRNARLAAIHSLFRYAALRHPEHAGMIARVLAIPPKRFDKALVTYLTEPELAALLAVPDRSARAGRRDHAMILLAAQTGLRISELTGVTIGDVHLGAGAHVCCTGKGRKQRITPLTTRTAAVLRTWIAECGGQPDHPLFPARTGSRLSRDAVEHRLAKHTAAAAARCPSLNAKTITAHTLRHTAAMRLLQSGTDTSVIALWLGHEQAETTQIYLHADLALKERALARTRPPDARPGRYRPPDQLLAFLEAL